MSLSHTSVESVEKIWTIKALLAWTSQRFQEDARITTPLLDAQLLLCHALHLTKIQLYIQLDKPLDDEERQRFRTLVKKRLQGEPVAYILGQKYWHDLDLFVDRRVLIPRPETETLLDFILQIYQSVAPPKIIFDFCTGSGCLAIALARRFPESVVVGVDVSADALAVAARNAEQNGVQKITWVQGDLFQKETYQNLLATFGQAHLIVANPPYVSEGEWQVLNPTVKDFEPRLALVSPEDGLALGRALVDNIPLLLDNSASLFAMELGEGQPKKLAALEASLAALGSQSWQIPKMGWFSLSDLEGRERFLLKNNNENTIVADK